MRKNLARSLPVVVALVCVTEVSGCKPPAEHAAVSSEVAAPAVMRGPGTVTPAAPEAAVDLVASATSSVGSVWANREPPWWAPYNGPQPSTLFSHIEFTGLGRNYGGSVGGDTEYYQWSRWGGVYSGFMDGYVNGYLGNSAGGQKIYWAGGQVGLFHTDPACKTPFLGTPHGFFGLCLDNPSRCDDPMSLDKNGLEIWDGPLNTQQFYTCSGTTSSPIKLSAIYSPATADPRLPGTYFAKYTSANYVIGSGNTDVALLGFYILGGGVAKLGPFIGFSYSTSYAANPKDLAGSLANSTWGPPPPLPNLPTSGPAPVGVFLEDMYVPAKMGAPHFVDMGQNGGTVDGYAYLVGHGRVDPVDGNTSVPWVNSWINGQAIYLARIAKTSILANPNNANLIANWQVYTGDPAGANPSWAAAAPGIGNARPIVGWAPIPGRKATLGNVSITYDAPLNRYFMMASHQQEGTDQSTNYDTMILEAPAVTGPWRTVHYLSSFGPQAYFVTMPSRFIAADGKTAWLVYSGNWSQTSTSVQSPAEAGYSTDFTQIILRGATELPPRPAVAPPRFYNFGPTNSPPWLTVRAGTRYTTAAGYGWDSGFLQEIERGSANPNGGIWTSIVYGTDGTFLADVPANGTYLMSLYLGDSFKHDNVAVYAGDTWTPVDNVTTTANQALLKSYPVAVTDGQLKFRLKDAGGTDPNFAVAGMTYVPTYFDFGPTGSPYLPNCLPVNETVAYDASKGYGWTAGTRYSVDRGVGGTLQRGIVFSSDMTFRVDLPNGKYMVNLWLGDMTNAHKTLVYLNQALVGGGGYQTAAGTVTQQAWPVTVTGGVLTVRMARDPSFADGNAAVAGLAINPQ